MNPNTMNLDLVQEMVTNYKTKQYLSIVTNTINPMSFDAQSIWFSLDQMKEFISTIEFQAERNGCPAHNYGIRFYYCAYPENESWGQPGYENIAELNPKYEKLHTLIAIPTAEIDGVVMDIDPSNPATFNGDKPSGVGVAIMAENHGSLIPPQPPIGTWF